MRKKIELRIQQRISGTLAGLLNAAAKFMPMPKPTMLIGAGSALELCDRIVQLGTQNIMLVTDKDLLDLGLTDPIQERLKKNGAAVTVYSGILPDPTVDQVLAGLDAYNRHGCDAILAVGGGSVLDAAKAISVVKTNDKPILDMEGYMKVRNPGAPLYAVPTTAGTGSEATIVSVISDSRTHLKSVIIDPKLMPTMAALDVDLMLGMPKSTTIFTGVDAMTHAIESFMSVNASDETDRYAVAAIQMIEKNLPAVVKKPDNRKAREEMAIASYYGGLAFTVASVGYVHAVSHRFGGHYGVPHGLANGIILPYVLDLMVEHCPERLAELSRRTGHASNSDSVNVAASKFVAFVRDFLGGLEIPEQVDALKGSDIDVLVEETLHEAHKVLHYPVRFYLSHETCGQLIRRMLPN